MTRDFIVATVICGAVDGQRDGLVGGDGEATGERERQQRRADQRPQHAASATSWSLFNAFKTWSIPNYRTLDGCQLPPRSITRR